MRSTRPPKYNYLPGNYCLELGIRRKIEIPPIFIRETSLEGALQMAKVFLTCHGPEVAIKALRYWYWTVGRRVEARGGEAMVSNQ